MQSGKNYKIMVYVENFASEFALQYRIRICSFCLFFRAADSIRKEREDLEGKLGDARQAHAAAVQGATEKKALLTRHCFSLPLSCTSKSILN